MKLPYRLIARCMMLAIMAIQISNQASAADYKSDNIFQPLIKVEGSGHTIGSDITRFVDITGQMTISELLQPSTQNQFALRSKIPMRSLYAATWLRIALRRNFEDSTNWELELAPALTDDLQFFTESRNGTYTLRYHVGKTLSFNSRPIDYRNFIFPFQLNDTNIHIIYIRIQNRIPIYPVVRLWLPKNLRYSVQRELIFAGCYFGLLLSISITNIVTGILLVERIYFSFALFALLIITSLMNSSGLSAQFLFPDDPETVIYLSGINYCLLAAGMLVLQRKSLNMTLHFPQIDRALPGLALLVALIGLLPLFNLFDSFAIIIPWILVFATVLNTMASWCEFRIGRPGALYILTGTAAYTLCTLFAVMEARGFGNLQQWTDSAWELGALILCVMMYASVFIEMNVKKKLLRKADNDIILTRALVEQERRLFDEQTAFFSFIAHELRTPLSIILSAVANLRIELATASQDVRDRIGRIAGSAKKLADLVERNLRLQQLVRGDFEPDFSEYSPDFSSIQAINTIREAHPHRLIEYTLDDNVPQLVIQDAELITHALLNLLENAIKYSPKAAPVKLSIKLDASNSDMIQYSVEDYGIGISDEDKLRLFALYSRARDNRNAGFGIGLTMALKIAKHHGGYIDCISTIGKGSTFILSLAMFASTARK